jgi:hypothetical protein
VRDIDLTVDIVQRRSQVPIGPKFLNSADIRGERVEILGQFTNAHPTTDIPGLA